jgi:hypothetical protein
VTGTFCRSLINLKVPHIKECRSPSLVSCHAEFLPIIAFANPLRRVGTLARLRFRSHFDVAHRT